MSRQYISENSSVLEELNRIDIMEGHDFEYWCADLLWYDGFNNIQVTRGSGDQGVDILAEKNGISYAIQCKCYSNALGNKPIQEVYAGKTFYNCHVGAVITNQYFTEGAKAAARKTNVILWDRRTIISILQSFLPMEREHTTVNLEIEKPDSFSDQTDKNEIYRKNASDIEQDETNKASSRLLKKIKAHPIISTIVFIYLFITLVSWVSPHKKSQEESDESRGNSVSVTDEAQLLEISQGELIDDLYFCITDIMFTRHNGNLKYMEMASDGLINCVVYSSVENGTDHPISLNRYEVSLICDNVEYEQDIWTDNEFLFFADEIKPKSTLTGRILDFQVPKDQQYSESEIILRISSPTGKTVYWRLR